MRKLLFIICFAIPLISQAQDLSIDDLWKDLAKNEKTLQAQTEYEIANLDLKAAKAKRLPLIFGDGVFQRNLIAPVTPVPAIAFNPNATPGDIIPLKFATDWSSRLGLNLSLDLFNPENKSNVKNYIIDAEIKALDVKQSQQDWKKQATLAYAKVVLSSQQYEQAIADTVLYNQILNVVKVRNKAGRILNIEVNKAEQEYLNKQTQLAEAYKVLEVANAELEKFINTSNFTKLSSSISEIGDKIELNTPDLNQQKIGLNQQKIEQQLVDLKLEALPKLTLNSYYGTQFFSNNLSSIWNNNYWNGNAFVNIGIRVPITETIDRSLKKQRLLLQKKSLDSQLREQQQSDASNDKQKNAQLTFALKALQNAQKSEQLAMQNLEITKSKYLEGKILLSEFNTEVSNHFKLKQQTWQAHFNYLESKLDFMVN